MNVHITVKPIHRSSCTGLYILRSEVSVTVELLDIQLENDIHFIFFHYVLYIMHN